MPLAKEIKGGFMIPECENLTSIALKISKITPFMTKKSVYFKGKLREDVIEANRYAASVVRDFKLDCLDLHYYFRKQIHRRAKDGIHWDVTGREN